MHRFRRWGAQPLRVIGGVVLVALAAAVWFGAARWRDQSALGVWHRSITLGADVPLQARLTLTRRKHGITYTTVADVMEASHGRYQMRYLEPKEAAGRIVYSDGHTFWQSEPGKQILATAPLQSAVRTSERATEELVKRNYKVVLVSDAERRNGRLCYLLEFLPRDDGKSTQRRWIDHTTYRTLRIESHYPDGILATSTNYEPTALPAQLTGREFTPPANAACHRMDPDATTLPPGANLDTYAGRLGLRSRGSLGFDLTQVSTGSLQRGKAAQLFYSDGLETISVFVESGGSLTEAHTPGWREIAVSGHKAYENVDGHLIAITWSSGGHRYTALGRLASPALIRFVEGLTLTP
jgi:outer membrane lipoprotein-sorting protein